MTKSQYAALAHTARVNVRDALAAMQAARTALAALHEAGEPLQAALPTDDKGQLSEADDDLVLAIDELYADTAADNLDTAVEQLRADVEALLNLSV